MTGKAAPTGAPEEDGFTLQQRIILRRLADKEAFWNEFCTRFKAKGKACALFGSLVTAAVGGWLAIKGLGINITWGGGE